MEASSHAPDPIEAGRRARAAVAYAGLDNAPAAEKIHVSVATLYRIFSGERPARWEELWALADACGLPREWFSADLSRLAEIVAEGQPTFARERFLQRLGRAAEQERQRRDSSREDTDDPPGRAQGQ